MFKIILGVIKAKFSDLYIRQKGFGSGKQFSEMMVQLAKPGTTVLDAGCGEGSLRELLPYDVHYVGTDIFTGDDATGYQGWKHKPTLLADLHELPLTDASCDIVSLFQVLEHVKSPQQVIGELVRVMKPGATIFMTMPFVHPVHHAPNDFFRYTKYGLEHLFHSAGLESVSIKPSGGYFRCLGNCLKYFIELYHSQTMLLKIVLSPLFLWITALKWSVKIFEYPLDLLDNEQKFVSGYLCIAKKGA